jgi:hypothetical protein
MVDEAGARAGRVRVSPRDDRDSRATLEVAPRAGAGVERRDADNVREHHVDGRCHRHPNRRAAHDDPADELIRVDRATAIEIRIARG